jgi:glyoxylase-like metal-dependent hydrolase (beta-lactamase superfamily II)
MKWVVGDVTITKVVELEMTGGSRFLLPQATPEAVLPIAWLRPHFANDEGRLIMAIQTFVVEAPGRRIVVDTCLGNDKEGRRIPHWNHRTGPFLDDLTAAGFPPDSIDTVLCTHLHVDHVGWNTKLENGHWVPTFRRAEYLMGRVEYAHWSTVGDRPDMAHIMADSVKPIVDAGLVRFVETDARLSPEIHLVPTAGHTPGHVSVMIQSRGEQAMITGDFIHHPCQMAHPEWSTTADSDADQGIATRRRMFAELAGSPTLVIGTHFAGATAGRIVRDGDAYRLDV